MRSAASHHFIFIFRRINYLRWNIYVFPLFYRWHFSFCLSPTRLATLNMFFSYWNSLGKISRPVRRNTHIQKLITNSFLCSFFRLSGRHLPFTSTVVMVISVTHLIFLSLGQSPCHSTTEPLSFLIPSFTQFHLMQQFVFNLSFGVATLIIEWSSLILWSGWV